MQAESLSIKLVADIADLQRKMQEAQKSVSGSMENIGKAASLARTALMGLAAGFSVGALASFVKSSIDAADRLNDLAASTGIAVDRLAGLQYAAKMSGTDIEGLASTLNKLSVNIANNSQKFAALGITARDPVEALKQLATVFGQIQDPQLRAAFGAEALGKSWSSAAPLLEEGAGGIQRLVEEGQKLNGITPEMAKQASEFNDELDKMATRAQGAALALSGPLIKAFNALNDKVKSGIESAGEYFGWLEKKQQQAPPASPNFPTTEQKATTESQVRVFIDGNKQANEAAKEMARFVENLGGLRNRLLGDANGIDADFLKNLALLKRGLDSGRVSLQDYVNLIEIYIKQQKFYQDQLKAEAELIKQFEQDGEKLAEQREKDFEQRLNQMESVANLVEQMEFEVQALQMTNVERETAIKLRELERLGVDKTSESYTVLAERIRQAVIDKEAVEASIQQQKEYARQWERITDQIGQSLTNSLIEGGKSAADYLKSLFRTLVLRPLLEPIIRSGVATVMGAMGLGTAGTASAAGAAGGGMQTVSTLSTLNSVYKALSNGLSSVGALAGAGVSAIGNLVGSASLSATGAGMGLTTAQAAAAAEAYSAAGMSNVASSLTTGAQLGAAANLLGGALVGFMAGKMISGGYSAIGKSGNTAVAVGTAIGAFVGGPIGAAIGGAVGGLFNRAFGRKLTQQGITGTFGGDGGFSGMNYTFEKGGWFRSNRTRYSAMDAELQAGMGAGFLALRQQIIAMGAALGQGAEAVMGFRRSITVNFMGMSSSQAQAALEQISREMSDAMATLIMGGDQFVQAGESATDALSRLYSRIIAVNGVLGAINQRLFDMTLVGADLASTLADAFGGLDKFNQATAYYYDNFFTDAERAANTTEQLRVALANMGYALPGTRDEFRAIVSGLDLATDAGRNMFVALMNLAPAFASITKSTDQLRTDAIENLRAAMGAGVFASGFEARRAQLLAANADNLAGLGINGFAAGGLHDGGLRLVGESGPELEVTGPARYYSTAETAALMGGGAEVASELRYLREENRAQSRAIIGLQNRMTKLLEQWDGDGLPATRVVA